MSEYAKFIRDKSQLGGYYGFDPIFLPDFLFPFQEALLNWSIRKGRAALFADCGLGKTPMQLVWAQNIVEKTNKSVLILAPIAVAAQTVQEGEKFGIQISRSSGGSPRQDQGLIVTNYEKLHHFDPSDFIGVVCDESSAIKMFSGARQKAVTQFMRRMPYRLLCTATAAPNDYIELGTSAEAIGELGRMDMLSRFFKNDEDSMHPIWWGSRWRLKPHGATEFWRWVCSWARAVRRPSDIGFEDDAFVLPLLDVKEHVINFSRPLGDKLFATPAITLDEQREERRATIQERCEKAAELIGLNTAVAWCHLNTEGDLLEKLIPDARQIAGSMSDEEKEELFLAFSSGQLKRLVTKPKLGGFGLNWQHCHHMTMFPSHSFEQYYQGIRRCWRFGQEFPVSVDIVTTEGEIGVLKNLQRKSEAAENMFNILVAEMNNAMGLKHSQLDHSDIQVPKWL